MKSILILFLLTLATNSFGQSQEIDPDIAELFKDISGSCEFIETLNYYLSIEFVEEIDKKDLLEFTKLCRCVNKKNIPIYEIRSNSKGMNFYFKKGSVVYSFSLEKRNDLYYSNGKCYTFKNRRVKKQGNMAFKT